jgi:hypothetical protein
MWTFGIMFALILLLIVVVAVLWRQRRAASRRFLWSRRDSIITVCLQCRGNGWIERRERTLEFTGEGFADVVNPSTMCPACHGTGQRAR